jgi:hypothetical protein
MNEHTNQMIKQPWITPKIEILPVKATLQENGPLDPPDFGNQELS